MRGARLPGAALLGAVLVVVVLVFPLLFFLRYFFSSSQTLSSSPLPLTGEYLLLLLRELDLAVLKSLSSGILDDPLR